jgi:hypothetical protein
MIDEKGKLWDIKEEFVNTKWLYDNINKGRTILTIENNYVYIFDTEECCWVRGINYNP